MLLSGVAAVCGVGEFVTDSVEVTAALAFRAASKARAPEAARAAAVATVVVAVMVADAVGADGEAVVDVPAATVLVSLGDKLASKLTVDDGVVAVMLAVLVNTEASGCAGLLATLLAGLRASQNAPAPMATARMPISAQGAELLFFLAEGGNCTGAASSGIGFVPLPLTSVSLLCAACGKAAGSVMGNCVAANCVLGPYSESL